MGRLMTQLINRIGSRQRPSLLSPLSPGFRAVDLVISGQRVRWLLLDLCRLCGELRGLFCARPVVSEVFGAGNCPNLLSCVHGQRIR